MNWRGFGVRIALAAVALPLIGVLIFLLPWRNLLLFNGLVIAVSVVGSLEVVGLFATRGFPSSRWLAPLLAGTLPLAAYLEVAGLVPLADFQLLWTVVAVGIILVRSIIFQRTATLPGLLAFTGSSLAALLYPGFFLAWIIRMSALPDPRFTVTFFLCVVFGDDMNAYFLGSLLGSSSRLNLPVSPQKSAVGFAAGIAGALIAALLFRWLSGGFPPVGTATMLLIAGAVGAVGIVGDLVESGLKRSAGVKDSGVVIPGRGGILDSVDSIALAAPVYYLLMAIARGVA